MHRFKGWERSIDSWGMWAYVGSPDIGVTGMIALKILERALDNVA